MRLSRPRCYILLPPAMTSCDPSSPISANSGHPAPVPALPHQPTWKRSLYVFSQIACSILFAPVVYFLAGFSSSNSGWNFFTFMVIGIGWRSY